MEITPQMYEYVERTVKNNDMQQDIFVKILEKQDGPSFDTWELQRNWLSAFISNHIRVTGRDSVNRDRLMDENDSLIRDIYGYDGESADPQELVIAEQRESKLLSTLTEMEKDVYGMVVAADICTYPEAAEVLNISVNAVYQHVNRIKRKFNAKET